MMRLDKCEPLALAQAGLLENSVYGVVDKVVDGEPRFIRRWKGTIGNMVPTEEEPTIFIIEKLEPIILKHKKYKALFGGRAGTKSIVGMDSMVGDVNSNGSKVFCLRERMKSLKNSIYAGMEARVSQLKLSGFTPVPSQWEIKHSSGGLISFGGMHNIRDIKSTFEYKFIFLEEADQTSQDTLDTLGPTLRGVQGAEMWLIWNPASANDAMSKQFIIPFQDDLDRCGYYEDEYRLIIKVGFEDNPWFMADQSLRAEYEMNTKDMKAGLMSKARYNHIWHGAFNDDVENSLIEADWFDACIDAHVKLGFEAKGAKICSHDPADVGTDAKTVAIRHGVVFTDMEEIDAINGNDGFDYACGFATKHNADVFVWDCDGMGALLRNQAATNFKGKKIQTVMFKGSEGVHNPDAICAATEHYGIRESKTNKDVLKNKRAQNYVQIAERCRKTYEAVVHGVYHNPDDLISFSSKIDCLQKLRSEMCRLPTKPNSSGTIELYSKADMRKGILMPDGSKFKIPSPNLADDVMMSFDNGCVINNVAGFVMPSPIRSMGTR